MLEKIETAAAPAAVGPYSQAIVYNGVIYASGQLGLVPETGKLAEGGVEAQAEQACKNVTAVLAAKGIGLEKVIKTTCFLADIKDFAEFNGVYEKYFIGKPARSCFAVAALPMGALCEIEVIAAVD